MIFVLQREMADEVRKVHQTEVSQLKKAVSVSSLMYDTVFHISYVIDKPWHFVVSVI